MGSKLKPCPFCGGEAEAHQQPSFMTNTVCIRCKECRTRTKTFPCDCTYQFYHGETKVFISKERATNDAINLWNTRTPNH